MENLTSFINKINQLQVSFEEFSRTWYGSSQTETSELQNLYQDHHVLKIQQRDRPVKGDQSPFDFINTLVYQTNISHLQTGLLHFESGVFFHPKLRLYTFGCEKSDAYIRDLAHNDKGEIFIIDWKKNDEIIWFCKDFNMFWDFMFDALQLNLLARRQQRPSSSLLEKIKNNRNVNPRILANFLARYEGVAAA